MKFHDLTVLAGRVHSRRTQDSTALDPGAVEVARGMLRRLRGGETEVAHGVEGIPDFRVALGLPMFSDTPGLDPRLQVRVAAPGRFFCVRDPRSELAWQVNLVLPGGDLGAREAVDRRAVATLLGISQAEAGGSDSVPTMEAIWQARPVLATTLLDMPLGGPELVAVAADFATCFAAAMLLEDAR